VFLVVAVVLKGGKPCFEFKIISVSISIVANRPST